MDGFRALGFTLRDKVTGFTGTATGHVRYITGCDQVLLNPKVDADGKLRESQWFDTQRLEYVDQSEIGLVMDNSEFQGSDKAAPKR